MAITTHIARGYAWRRVIIAIGCLVIGVWGMYDYWVKIPRQQELVRRLEVVKLCKSALEMDQPADHEIPETREARARIMEELELLLQREADSIDLEELPAPEDPTFPRFVEVPLSDEDGAWLATLQVIDSGLRGERRLPLGDNHPEAHRAYEKATETVEAIGKVTAPARYDKLVQLFCIASLPFVPYLLLSVWTTSRRRYRLDDDGTLHTPEGTWAPGDIADIDMGRWMAKSIAHVVHRDGRRILLDDFKHQDLHLIVGAIAHRLHPDDWTAEARPAATAAAEAATRSGAAERDEDGATVEAASTGADVMDDLDRDEVS